MGNPGGDSPANSGSASSGSPSTDSATRHVCICSDTNYVVPLAVTLRSILESQPCPERVHVTVGSFGIAPADEERIRESAGALHVEFVSLAEHVPDDIPPSAHVNHAAYGRTKVFDFLPAEATHALFLDTDLVVRDDLETLFAFDLDGAVLAAVQSAIVSQSLPQWRELGLPPLAPYLQTGVFVADLAAWRARGLGDAVLRFAFEHGDTLRWADQDGFNALLGGRFPRLPLRWNAESSLRRSTNNAYTLYPPDEVEAARADPAIVHYSGMAKPWHADSVDPRTSDWLELLSRTAYRGWTPEPTRAATAPGGPLLKTRRRAVAMARRLLRV